MVDRRYAGIKGRDASMLVVPSTDPEDTGSIIIRLQDAVGGFAAGRFDPDQIRALRAAMAAALGLDGVDGEMVERVVRAAFAAGQERQAYVMDPVGHYDVPDVDAYTRRVLAEVGQT